MHALPRTTASEHHDLAMMLAALSALGPFSTDTYLPSLHDIGREFSASPVMVQQTLTAYMVPFAMMTLWHGAISDALGRRRVTLVSLTLFFVASLGCMFAWNLEALLVFRALQGMTAGTGMVVGRAIVRDVLDGEQARRLMARITLMFALAPAAGPVVGGWLHVWFGWRSVFAFLSLFVAVVLAWCWRLLPETLPREQRQPLHAMEMLRAYGAVLRTPTFLLLVFAVTFNFSALFLYIVSAPAFLLDLLHVRSTEFLWLFGPITAGMLVGTWISERTAAWLSNVRTVRWAYLAMSLGAASNLVYHALFAPKVPFSILPLVVYSIGSSLAMPSLTILALDVFPLRKGLASSCQGFVQSGGNAIVTAGLAPLLWSSTLTLAGGQFGGLLLGILSFSLYGWLSARGSQTDSTRKEALDRAS